MEMNITEDILEKYKHNRKSIFLARLDYLNKQNYKNRTRISKNISQFRKK